MKNRIIAQRMMIRVDAINCTRFYRESLRTIGRAISKLDGEGRMLYTLQIRVCNNEIRRSYSNLRDAEIACANVIYNAYYKYQDYIQHGGDIVKPSLSFVCLNLGSLVDKLNGNYCISIAIVKY